MKMAHPLLSKPLCFDENRVQVLVVEHPVQFRTCVFDLTAQARGEVGPFVFSTHHCPLDGSEHLFVLSDYQHLLTEDDRALQSRFQKLLAQTVLEEMAPQSAALNSAIADFLGQLSVQVGYPMESFQGNYTLALLKWLKCRAAPKDAAPLGRLTEYLDLVSGLFSDVCFVLISAHSYFCDRELEILYQTAAYHKWNLLILEQRQNPTLPQESVCIIDRQMCEIRLDETEKP